MTITVEDYQALLLAAVTPRRAERVPLDQALGRVLAEDMLVLLDVPPWTNSAMDGFAVCAQDLANQPVTLEVIGDIPAGAAPPTTPVGPGTAMRIMTGAPLPPGADSIVPVELTDHEAGPYPAPVQVTIDGATPLRHVRRQGEDMRVGQRALAAGHRLRATSLSALASIGYAEVPVVSQPRVLIVTTGDELVPPGQPLQPGQIPDSNTTLLRGLLHEFGLPDPAVVRLTDDPEAALAQLDAMSTSVDLIISTGGVSMGAFDVIKHIGRERGLAFYKVAMQPGKPQGFGLYTVPGAPSTTPGPAPTTAQASAPITAQAVTPIPSTTTPRYEPAHHPAPLMLTLPGNPVSVFVSFHAFVGPVLATLMGLDPAHLYTTLTAQAATSWDSPAGRAQFVPVTMAEGSAWYAEQGTRVAPMRKANSPDDHAEDHVHNHAEERTNPEGSQSQDHVHNQADERANPEGSHTVRPVHTLGSSSHLVATLPQAEALAIVPADQTQVVEGSPLTVLVRRPYL